MKHLKVALFSLALIVMSFSSCTNNESVDQGPDTEESASITTALTELSYRFNNDGSLNETESVANNIVFDFCFDFVYPLSLSYNNGVTVTVNDLNGLIEVLITSTSDLYISGIAFPFNVEVFNDDSDAIEIVTINNEEEFIMLLEDCDFDNDFCECEYDEYDPVCVEILSASGETFIMTFPNECIAECEGFTEDDFIDDCDDDTNNDPGDDDDCFSFNFPISIVTDSGETITVNSQEELDVALYDVYYFDFVYPFTITQDGEVETINNEDELFEALEECYDYDYDDECDDCEYNAGPVVCVEVADATGSYVISFPNACFAECEGFSSEDFIDCGNTGGNDCNCTSEYDPVCVEIETGSGGVAIITFPNECIAECEGFTEEDFIDCEDDGDGNGDTDDCEDCSDEEDLVCVEVETPAGEIIRLTFLNECHAYCEGFTANDFIDCEDGSGDDNCGCSDEVGDNGLVCVEITENGATYTYEFPNECQAECAGFTEEDFVDCN
ncbi:hypothetical protein A9Q87_07630 [Flavobacteriales bacterium 34_180_T64]|nr:hypothetical protein A9Q87_07630 [Flavobacteriales bacterium 34_180_T64]